MTLSAQKYTKSSDELPLTVRPSWRQKDWLPGCPLLTEDAQNARNVVAGFGVRGDAPKPIDGVLAGVVRGERQAGGREPVQQRLQILDPALDVLPRVIGVGDRKAPGRLGHELHEAYGAFRRSRTLLIIRFDLDDSAHETGRHAVRGRD